MKLAQLLFLAVGSFLLISEARVQPSSNSVGDKSTTSTVTVTSPVSTTTDEDMSVCRPGFWGSFPYPKDCSKYYYCYMEKTIKTCPQKELFDAVKKNCQPEAKVHCGTRQKPQDKSTSTVTVTSPVSTTTDEDWFVCPFFWGSFPHPKDCSKYYSCYLEWTLKHTLETCPQKELFDAVQKTCQPEAKVHCGTRQKPQDLTTTEKPDETTTVEEQTPTEGNETEKDFETDTPVTTLETTVVIDTTTKARPTGPPEHDCDEDDLDCIITETGDEWFKCPDDVGSYPHPSSENLFIFCMNWIPSVKKCGLDLVFSKELSTCVENLS